MTPLSSTLTFHKAVNTDGSKIDFPSLGSVSDALAPRSESLVAALKVELSGVKREGLCRLLAFPYMGYQQRERACRVLKDEVRYSGGYVPDDQADHHRGNGGSRSRIPTARG